MILTLHGTGAGTPGGDRAASALTATFADGSVVLFDAGEACARSMIRDGIDINAITTVAISHMHPDHWAGLPGLIVGWATLGRDRRVRIHVPPGTRDFFREVETQSLVFREKLDFVIRYRRLKPFDLREGWHVELFATSHLDKIRKLAKKYGASAPAFGYVLRCGARKIVLSQDLGSEHDLVGVIQGAELVICESSHVDPLRTLEMAADAGVGRLIFTHVRPGGVEFPASFDRIPWNVAVDGERIEIQ